MAGNDNGGFAGNLQSHMTLALFNNSEAGKFGMQTEFADQMELINRKAFELGIRDTEKLKLIKLKAMKALRAEQLKLDQLTLLQLIANTKKHTLYLLEETKKALVLALAMGDKAALADAKKKQKLLEDELKYQLRQIKQLSQLKIDLIRKESDISRAEAKKLQAEAKKARLDDLKEKQKSGKLSPNELKEYKKLLLTINPDYKGPQTGIGKAVQDLGTLGSSFGDLFTGIKDLGKVVNALTSITGIINGVGDKYFKEAENALIQYQGKINSRLQGTDNSYRSIAQSVDKVVTSIPIAKNTEVIQQVSTLLNQGITYNVEQRAFIESVAGEIVSGFSATASSIKQIVRVQREDSTAARLGMASSLQTMLNLYFSDTSYLTDKFSLTADSLLEAATTMNKEQATEFEFVVQKWLGAMYSSGMGSTTVGNISSALNKLGTGDVSGLSASEINLMAMAANRAGLSFSDILTGGLNAQNTNDLLKAVVEYLAEISNNTNNNVIKKAYGQVFGISLTDLQAVKTVAGEVANLYKESMSYADMYAEANYQTGTGIVSRMSTAKLVENMVSNLMYSSANNLVTNPTAYLTYKAADIVGDIAGANKAVSLVTGLIKSGMFGVSFMSELLANGGSMINALGTNLKGQFGRDVSGSTLSALNLLGTETTMRGTGGYRSSASGTSLSLSKSSADSGDKSLSSAADQYSEEKKITREITSDEKDVSDIYSKLFNVDEDGQLTAVRDHTKITKDAIQASYNESKQSLKVIITGYEGDSNGIPIKYSGNDLTGYTQAIMLSGQIKQAIEETNNTLNEVAPNVDGTRTVGVNLLKSDISLNDMITGSSIDNTGKYQFNTTV